MCKSPGLVNYADNLYLLHIRFLVVHTCKLVRIPESHDIG